MSLKSMVSELYGKLANFDLVVDISKYFSTNTRKVRKFHRDIWM